MIYAIERWDVQMDLPFDNSFASVTIQSKIYDLVKSQKDTGLDKVSDFIIDDNQVLVKSDPRLATEFKQEVQKTQEIYFMDLLLE